MHYSLILVLTFVLSFFTALSSASNTQSLYEASKEVLNSTFTSELIFNCDNLTFKLYSNLFVTKLYWKSGLDWEILDDVEFKDTGLIFRGLGSANGVPIRSMNIDVDLPMLKGSRAYKNDFFIRASKSDFVSYEYTVDFLKSVIETTNLYDVSDKVILDLEAYKKEQMFWLNLPHTLSMSEREREEKKSKDILAIEETMARLSEEIRVLTKAGEIKKSSRCFIKN
jgi:hypothetical protein